MVSIENAARRVTERDVAARRRSGVRGKIGRMSDVRTLAVVAVSLLLLGNACTHARPDPFAAVRDTMRCDAWERLAGLSASGFADADGLRLRFIEHVDTRSGAFIRSWRSTPGEIPGGEGFDGVRAWTQDRSGASHDLDAPSSRALAVTNAWLERRGWCHPPTGIGVTALGERRSERSTFDVFRVTPERGAPVEVWIDRAKHVIARTTVQLPEDREVKSYSDWRLVNGVTIPFIRSIDYPEDESKEVWVTTLANGSTVASPSTTYASPAPPNDVAMGAGVAASTVRLQLIRDKPRVSVRLNGRGPFIYVLDTGGHFIATPATARVAGLHGIGATNELGAGTGILSAGLARVGRVQIGNAIMRDQVAKVIPYASARLNREGLPEATGWLGLETFERFAVTLNPARSTATFVPLQLAAQPKGVRVPITFDEDAPLVDCAIDGYPGECMIDTGNGGDTIVEGHWASRNGLARRLARGRPGPEGFYASHATVAIGSIGISNVPVVYSPPAIRGSESTTTVAAILSESVLRRYVMTIDYGRSAIWFAPR